MKKVAVLSGASYGLGREICNKLIDLDFKVYGISRSEPIINNPNFIWIKADLLQDEDLAQALEQIPEKHLDLLINNAGVCFLKKTLDYNDTDFEKMFSMNFIVHIKLTKHLFEKLTHGLIINISSLGDRYPDATWGLYGSSKAALNIFFEIMADENKLVKIYNILPSFVDTPMQHQIHDGTDFDWSQCMNPVDIATALGDIITNKDKIESGSRIIIDKDVNDEESYRPEKVWVYSAKSNTLKKIN